MGIAVNAGFVREMGGSLAVHGVKAVWMDVVDTRRGAAWRLLCVGEVVWNVCSAKQLYGLAAC